MSGFHAGDENFEYETWTQTPAGNVHLFTPLFTALFPNPKQKIEFPKFNHTIIII